MTYFARIGQNQSRKVFSFLNSLFQFCAKEEKQEQKKIQPHKENILFYDGFCTGFKFKLAFLYSSLQHRFMRFLHSHL